MGMARQGQAWHANYTFQRAFVKITKGAWHAKLGVACQPPSQYWVCHLGSKARHASSLVQKGDLKVQHWVCHLGSKAWHANSTHDLGVPLGFKAWHTKLEGAHTNKGCAT
ncbi:hypothetical protein AHAS_Ahas20G0171300 [Arachis hypogaea]